MKPATPLKNLPNTLLGFASYLAQPALAATDAAFVLAISPPPEKTTMSFNEARAIFSMRVRTWPHSTPITVFILPDDNNAHRKFIRSQLKLLPHQLNLETAVGRETDVQDIDVQWRFEKLVVTILVMSAFSNFPGALRACAYFRDPTAVSRLKRNWDRMVYTGIGKAPTTLSNETEMLKKLQEVPDSVGYLTRNRIDQAGDAFHAVTLH